MYVLGILLVVFLLGWVVNLTNRGADQANGIDDDANNRWEKY